MDLKLDFKPKQYSWLLITRTRTNSNFAPTRTKVDSSGFPSYIYCNYTLDNSNLSLTRSKFLFSFRSFLYNFILENSNHIFSAREVGKKNSVLSPKYWIYFKTTVSILYLYFCCYSSSNSVSIPILKKLCCLISIISLAALKVKCAWYLDSLPIHLLPCLRLFALNSR